MREVKGSASSNGIKSISDLSDKMVRAMVVGRWGIVIEIAGNIICVMSVLDVCCAKITWPELQNVTERRNWTLLMRTKAIFTQCVDGECLAGREQ